LSQSWPQIYRLPKQSGDFHKIVQHGTFPQGCEEIHRGVDTFICTLNLTTVTQSVNKVYFLCMLSGSVTGCSLDLSSAIENLCLMSFLLVEPIRMGHIRRHLNSSVVCL